MPREAPARQCSAHQTRINSISTDKSFIHRSLARSVTGLKITAVSIREPLKLLSTDKPFCRSQALVGFEGNLRSAGGYERGLAGRRSAAMTRLLRFFRPSHQHTAFSATLLLMSAVMLSRVVGYLREAYIAFAFGAGPQTDAYVAAFTLPDWLNYSQIRVLTGSDRDSELTEQT